MNDLLNSGTTTSTSNQKPISQKYLGYAVWAALTGLLLYVLYNWAPYITKALTNGIYLILATVGFIFLLWLFWEFKGFLSYWAEVISRWVWKSMIEADPISGMRYAYSKWARDTENINTSVIELESKESELKDKLAKNEREANSYFAAGKKAKEMAGKAEGDEAADLSDNATANTIKASRRKETIEILLPRLQLIQKALDFQKKLYKSWMRGLDLLKDNIDVNEETLADLKSIANAFRTAQSIVNGNSNERATYEMSVAAYSKKVNAYVGECKRFAEQAKTWSVNQDIQTAIESDESNRMLEMYDEAKFKELTNFSALLDSSPQRVKKTMAQSSNEFTTALDKPKTGSDFTHLL